MAARKTARDRRAHSRSTFRRIEILSILHVQVHLGEVAGDLLHVVARIGTSRSAVGHLVMQSRNNLWTSVWPRRQLPPQRRQRPRGRVTRGSCWATGCHGGVRRRRQRRCNRIAGGVGRILQRYNPRILSAEEAEDFLHRFNEENNHRLE